jgi:hypothetical protein
MDRSLGFQPDPMTQQFLAQLQPQQHTLMEGKAKTITRRKFTPEEDDVLRTLVAQYEKSDWSLIAQHFQNRTPRQCRDRWKHYLAPDVLVGNWSEADDQLLLAKVAELGQRWAAITQLFPGRTDIGVKNHYISITSRKNKEGEARAIVGTTFMQPEPDPGRPIK